MGKKETTIKDIFQNYVDMEATIVKQLNFNAEHPTTIGGYREEIWKSLFEQIIPKKFSIERSVFIIDSEGNVSNEVDLAIFDEQYTPYIFRYGTLKFIPIEAVAVVIECKSTTMKEVKMRGWSKSIDDLKTSLNSITRMANKVCVNKSNTYLTQTSTRPIKVLCYVKQNEDKHDYLKKCFDFIIKTNKKKNKLEIVHSKNETLSYWHNELNHYKEERDRDDFEQLEESQRRLEKYEVNGSSILTLIFQLNQLLMLINNPMLFPHMSYVKLFNDLNKERAVIQKRNNTK